MPVATDTPRITLTGSMPAITIHLATGSASGGGGAVNSVNGETGTVVLDAADVGALPDDTVIPDISGLQPTSEKNQPNGYAGLDGDGTIPDNRIPSSIARDSEIGSQISAAIDALLDGAPGALDTLNELAAAVNDDASFAASVTTALAGKVPTSRTLAGLDLTVDRSDAALRTALGLVIGTNVQAADSDLSAIAALATLTYGRSFLTMPDAASARTLLGNWSATRGAGTAVTDTATETTLPSSTVTLPALAAGEAVEFAFDVLYLNNSGTNRIPTWRLKVGSTTVLTLTTANMSTTTADRIFRLEGTIYAIGSNSMRATASGFFQATNGGLAIASTAATGTATEAIQTAGLALDLTVQHPASTSTQTAQLLSGVFRKVIP